VFENHCLPVLPASIVRALCSFVVLFPVSTLKKFQKKKRQFEHKAGEIETMEQTFTLNFLNLTMLTSSSSLTSAEETKATTVRDKQRNNVNSFMVKPVICSASRQTTAYKYGATYIAERDKCRSRAWQPALTFQVSFILTISLAEH
jgi:hypothetical protein